MIPPGRPLQSPALSGLLCDSSPDVPLIIGRFIRAYNAAYGNPAAERWEIAKEDWQRYEFLGDRVLNLVVARMLFARGTRVLDEGAMTEILSSVVSNQALAALAKRLDPAGFARLIPASIGEQNNYGERIVGGAVEAFIGALYCEAGIDDAACFIAAIMEESLDHYDPQGNSIGLLQERYQKAGMGIPRYDTVARTGPDHHPVFTVRVTAPDGRTAEGTGPNLGDARRAAARAVLDRLEETGR